MNTKDTIKVNIIHINLKIHANKLQEYQEKRKLTSVAMDNDLKIIYNEQKFKCLIFSLHKLGENYRNTKKSNDRQSFDTGFAPY